MKDYSYNPITVDSEMEGPWLLNSGNTNSIIPWRTEKAKIK